MSSPVSPASQLLLRMLLEPTFVPDPLDARTQASLLPVARAGHVIIRAAEALELRKLPVPVPLAEAAARERERVRATVHAIRQVQEVCAQQSVPCVFLKSFKHYPDMGHDIDLLVPRGAAKIDRQIGRVLPFTGVKRGLAHGIAGSVTFELADCPSPLEIFHGRLGLAGELAAYADQVVRNRRQVTVEGARFWVPAREDQFLLQALGLVWVRPVVRLSDLASAIRTLREPELDWDYLLATARRLGTLPALSCCVSYAERLHRELFDRVLLPPPAAGELLSDRWGHPALRREGYPLPLRRLLGPFYGARLQAALRSRAWQELARLSLVPGLGLAALLRRGGRRTRRLLPARASATARSGRSMIHGDGCPGREA